MKGGRGRAQHRYRHDASRTYVGFQLGGVRYALPIAGVREITRPLRIVELPDTPPGVVGVAEYRGDVVPVVDLRQCLGHGPGALAQRAKWIIASASARTLALVVDSISEVFGVLDEPRPAPPSRTREEASTIVGVVEHDGLVFVLDEARLVTLAPALGGRGPAASSSPARAT
jgi:chemotaxis signal transduction protein